MNLKYASTFKIAILCFIFGLSASFSFAAKDPWVEEMKNAVGLSVGDLTPIDIESDKPDVPDTEQKSKPGIGVDLEKPIDPDRLNPDTQPDVAATIKEWLSVAQPPENAVPGNNFYYDKFGRMLGSGKGMETIRQRDDVQYGAGVSPEQKVWINLRKGLDSIDHCTLEEYVVAKLKNESISHCQGRYGGVRDLAGEQLSTAKNVVESGGFKPSIAVGSPAKSLEEEGTIEKQEPDWKKPLKKGETIKLVVHSPYVPAGAVLPDFIGKPLRKAKEWLQDNNFEVALKPGSTAPSPELSGAVEAQDPAAGATLKKGEKVFLTVHSAFVDTGKVPDITGMKLADAKAAVRNQGLEVALRPGRPAPSRDKSGTVESQQPAAGSAVERGATVTLRVHSDYVEQKTVPEVTGLSASAAKSRIAEAGLKPVLHPGGAPSSRGQAGKVARMRPEPGTVAGPGAQVEIFVYGPYAETITVPDVKNLSYADAKRRLEAKGLYIDKKDAGQPRHKSMANMAERQDPAPGTQVGKGNMIIVWFYGDSIVQGEKSDKPTGEESEELVKTVAPGPEMCPPVAILQNNHSDRWWPKGFRPPGSRASLSKDESRILKVKYAGMDEAPGFMQLNCVYDASAPGYKLHREVKYSIYLIIEWDDGSTKQGWLGRFCRQDKEYIHRGATGHILYSKSKRVLVLAQTIRYDIEQALMDGREMIKKLEPYAVSCDGSGPQGTDGTGTSGKSKGKKARGDTGSDGKLKDDPIGDIDTFGQ